MRCFLPPLDKKGVELYKCLKRKHYSLKHVLRTDVYTMLAYNQVYYDVTTWLYATVCERTRHGYIYMLTLRNLQKDVKHSHQYVV
jgi:hypothetical protein